MHITITRRLRIPVLAVVLAAILWPARMHAITPTELFISEYVEGSSNNKAIEIYNGTGAAVDLALGGYSLQYFFNGSASAGLTINLTGAVANGDVYVVAQSSANSTILAQADQTNSSGWYNGDDAVVLRKGTTVIDVIGQIGVDPGAEWGSGLTSTADNTLRRKSGVCAGDANGGDAFDPALEWDGFAQDTFDGLGAHTAACVAGPTNPAGTGAASPASLPAGGQTLLTVAVTPGQTPASTGLTVAADLTAIGGAAAQPFFDDGTNGDVTAGDNTFAYLATVAPATVPGPKALLATLADAEARSSTTTINLTVEPPITPIHDLQGAGHTSPLNGLLVATEGIVTAVASNGFYVQTPDGQIDANSATSEGIFVFTGAAPAVAVGDAVRVTGTVKEFQPGGASTKNLTTTELDNPGRAVTVLSQGNPLPAATVIGSGGRIPPATVIDDDGLASFDPDTDGIDFYESLEGMFVQVNAARVVGPTNGFGETWVVGDDGANASPFTARGGIQITPTDFNPERIQLEDDIFRNLGLGSWPALDVGARFTAPVAGVVAYNFGNFEVLVTSPVAFDTAGAVLREATTLVGDADRLTVATFNVENLGGNADPTAFATRANLIVNHLGSPDILVLEEMQDNNGPTNDGTVAADMTFANLIGAIQSAGGPLYAYQQIDPIDLADGGVPGGNIRVGFLFNPARVAFVPGAAGDATTANSVLCTSGVPALALNPGRIDPANAAFIDSRKPLAGQFEFAGETIFVVGVHFSSKGGDDPLFGNMQPPVRYTEAARIAQAQAVNGFVASILACEPQAKAIVLGDVNDFQFSAPVAALKGSILTNLMDLLPFAEQYSYVFQGNSQVLDQAVVSASLIAQNKPVYDVVHVNAEFASQVSDHDPSVAAFCMDTTPPTVSVALSPNSLWPPNHQLVEVTAAVTVDEPDATVTLLSAISSEPDNGLGDGDTAGDIVIVDPATVQLRAERAGGGSGRVYTLTYQAVDGCGNIGTASATVIVPASQGNGAGKDKAVKGAGEGSTAEAGDFGTPGSRIFLPSIVR